MANVRNPDKDALKIVNLWLDWMTDKNTKWDSLQGLKPQNWLELCSVDSGMMHENCDANMVFSEILGEDFSQEATDYWNTVTAMNRLEKTADKVLSEKYPDYVKGQDGKVWYKWSHENGGHMRFAMSKTKPDGWFADYHEAVRNEHG